MAKKIIAMVLMACLLCSMLAGCKSKITSDQALQIVMDDLGDASSMVSSTHVHNGTHDGKPCFNIYVTVNGVSLAYVVSETGKILSKGAGDHSH